MRREESGAQKLTRESTLCAVSEPEASPYCVSPRVAFVSVFVAPDHFLPLRSPPSARHRYVLLSRPVLFRESSSRQERTRTLSYGTARQRGVMYDLTGRDAFLSRFLSPLHKSWRVKKNRGVQTRAFFFSAQCRFERSTSQSDC